MSAVITQIEPVELSVVVKGEVVSENFEAFKAYLTSLMEGVNLDLKTDEDFKQAKSDIADLKKIEARLAEVDKEIIGSMDHINKLITGNNELREVAGEKRKHLVKLAKDRTAELKTSLVNSGIEALEVKSSEFEKLVRESIKGMSSLEKMQEKITSIVEGINKRIEKAREIIESCKIEHGSDICHGEKALLLMPIEAMETELERRVERREADRKAEALRKEAEEQRAKAEALAKAKAEEERIRKEREAEAEEVRKRLEAQKAEEEALSNSEKSSPIGESQSDAHEEQGEESAGVSSSPINKPSKPADSSPDPIRPSAKEEMACFLSVFPSAFAPIKEARAKLTHPENIAVGERFAEGFAELYAELERGAK